jgi:hypothetical protein
MELSPPWEVASCAAHQELTNILWNQKVHCRVQKSPPLVPVLSQINPVRTIPSSLRSIFILSFHIHLGLPSGLLPPGFPTKTLYAFLSSPIHSKCPVNLVLVDLIILIVTGDEYKLRSSSACSFLQPPVTLSLFGPNILLSTLSLCSSLNVRDQVSHPYKTEDSFWTVALPDLRLV